MLTTPARRQSKNPAIGEVYEVDPSSCILKKFDCKRMWDVIDVLHQVNFESIASMIRH